MQELEKNELISIKGGGFSFWTGVIIVGIVSFVSGIIDGIARPLDCNLGGALRRIKEGRVCKL